MRRDGNLRCNLTARIVGGSSGEPLLPFSFRFKVFHFSISSLSILPGVPGLISYLCSYFFFFHFFFQGPLSPIGDGVCQPKKSFGMHRGVLG